MEILNFYSFEIFEENDKNISMLIIQMDYLKLIM